MKTLKEQIVEILKQIEFVRIGGMFNGNTAVKFSQDQLGEKELDIIASQILSLISQDREELAGKIEGLRKNITNELYADVEDRIKNKA